jgi:acetoin utilization deacetylase AcuC-like enzyme
MAKYDLLPELLIREGSISPSALVSPAPMEETDILRIHTPDYWQKLRNVALSPQEQRRTGFPLSEELVLRERIIMQGTSDCMAYAMEHGISLNIAGGTHHAFAERGEGFCLLNDLALAASGFIRKFPGKRVLIIDLDVHQGNGTAAIFANDSSVFTFSMHGESNYPMHKENSDLDIALPDGTGDAAYLRILETSIHSLFRSVEPGLVLYQCGVDVLETDKLGKLSLSLEGCKERDFHVMSACRRANVPLVCAMGGGYSPDVGRVVEAHANTFRTAVELYG